MIDVDIQAFLFVIFFFFCIVVVYESNNIEINAIQTVITFWRCFQTALKEFKVI